MLSEMRALRVLAPGRQSAVQRLAFRDETIGVLEAVAVLVEAIAADSAAFAESLRRDTSQLQDEGPTPRNLVAEKPASEPRRRSHDSP
jgi:hypothetical protein